MDVMQDAAYAAFDKWGPLRPGTVLRFWVGDRLFAALFIDDRWFVTGRESPNGLPTEDFVAWLIERGVAAWDPDWLL
jgi:hypothetical protein